MISKIQDIAEKRPRRPESGNQRCKDGLKEMELEFPLGTFQPEKQNKLFRYSVAPGNLPLKRSKTSCSVQLPNDFLDQFCKW